MISIRAITKGEESREIVKTQQQEVLAGLRARSLSILNQLQEKVEDVVLCLDISGSMTGEKIKTLKKAVLRFVLAKIGIDIRDRTAVVVFGDPARKLFDLTNNKDFIKKEVSELEISGATAIGHALSLSREILSHSRKARKQPRIILLSDGCANGPGDPGRSLEEAQLLKKFGVIIDTIGIGEGSESFDEDLLKEIAKITGGKYLRVEDISKLPKKFAILAEKKAMLPFETRLRLEEKKI